MWQNNKGVVIGLIVGLVIGYAVGVSWGRSSGRSEESATMEVGSGQEEANLSSDLILVSDQKAGQKVTVASVSTDKPTWVAVREDINGGAGDILGATLLPVPGANKDIEVDLLVPTIASSKYHINLYADNGDHFFDNRVDTLLEGDSTFSAN